MRTKREYITAVGSTAVIPIAGCLGGDGEGDGNGDNGDSNGNENGGDGDGTSAEMEILNAWTGEDGGPAVEALQEGFKDQHPNIELVFNTNPGGAGTSLATALDTRMFNEDPPSTWGFFLGPDLTDYVEAGLMGDITEDVWEEENLEDVVPEYLQDLAHFGKAGYVGVPIEFNRLNNLFYNTAIVEEADVDPGEISAPSDLLSAMEQVEAETDAVGMAKTTQAPWTVLQLWEAIHLGEYGFNSYTSMLDGNIEENEEEIKGSLQLVTEYTDYFNEDAGSINFTESISRFIGRNAAFLHQGDWAVGNFMRADNYDYEDDWLAVSFPGSNDAFMGQCSGYMYPDNNPTPEATKKWLRYIGSVDAQIRFNSHKGGVPCRKDAPMDDDEWVFNEHQQSQYQDFLDAENLIGTIAHNNVVVPQIASSVYDVFSSFAGNWDVDNAYNGLVDAFDV